MMKILILFFQNNFEYSNILNNNTNSFHAVIPGKTLNEINKIIVDSFDTIKIGISKNQALFEMVYYFK